MTDLKRHDVPNDLAMAGWTLEVTGNVDQPLELTQQELTTFPAKTFRGDFHCEEGWVAENLTWRGVRVGAILDRAEPTEAGEYGLVRAMDGSYACSFPMSRLVESVLAYELDGKSLDPEHGGPARLVPTATDRDCWESVKWVAEIEICDRAPVERDTAQSVALGRLE